VYWLLYPSSKVKITALLLLLALLLTPSPVGTEKGIDWLYAIFGTKSAAPIPIRIVINTIAMVRLALKLIVFNIITSKLWSIDGLYKSLTLTSHVDCD
jgi:hypothetical protein